MADEQALAHLDGEALERLLDSLKQGDIIRVEVMTALVAPDFTLFPEEVDGAPRDEPLVATSFESPTGLGVIVSQDCEVSKAPANEGWLTVAPLALVDDTTYTRASHGRSTRYFAYPDIDDHSNLAVDAGMLMTVEKAALLSPQVEALPCPLTGPRREKLRQWLGRRLGRYAFSDEFQKKVVDKVEAAITKLADDANHARVLAATIFYGIRYTEENAHYGVLFLLDPALCEANKVSDELLNATRKRLIGLLAASSKDTGYSPEIEFEQADRFPASKLFAYSPFDPGA